MSFYLTHTFHLLVLLVCLAPLSGIAEPAGVPPTLALNTTSVPESPVVAAYRRTAAQIQSSTPDRHGISNAQPEHIAPWKWGIAAIILISATMAGFWMRPKTH
jgi:hypothetical protein